MESYLAVNIPLFIKLVVAVILGAAIGTERTLAHKVAGMRTYALVALGSCLLTLIAESILHSYGTGAGTDPTRMASAIVMGIGFLCGGLIVFQNNHLSGLTTAAGMWVATGIGIAVGLDLYTLAVITSVLTIFIFSTLWEFEEKFKSDSEGSTNQ
jgi:putative Mg2+ transporter-C (MgtC) family protein